MKNILLYAFAAFFILSSYAFGKRSPSLRRSLQTPVADTSKKPVKSKKHLNNADTLRKDSTKNDSVRLKKDSVKLKAKDGSEFNSEVDYNSKDSTIFDVPGKKVYLYRDAIVKYEDVTLKAGFIEMNQLDATIFAKGILDTAGKYIQKPEVTQGGSKIVADSLRYNFHTKKTLAWEGVNAQGEGFIRGGKIKLDQNKEGFLKNGIYTTCNLDHPHFGIRISKAKINKNTIVTAPSYLFIEDVPVPLILPFGFFPKTDRRANGILFPRIGEDATLGFFLQDFGYYQGLGENLDAQIRASIYSKGSYGVRIDSRYNFKYKSTGNVSFTYNDRMSGDKASNTFSDTKDFNLTWTHSQSEKASPGSTFSASVNAASNSYFRNNTIYYNINSRVQNSIGSSINYSKIWQGTPFSLNVGLTHSQNLAQRTLSLSFPNVNFSVTRINPFDSKDRSGPQKWYQKIGFSYTLSGQNSLNTTTSGPLFKSGFLSKFQNGILHNPSVTFGTYNVLKYFLVTPSISYTERWYFQTYRQFYDFTYMIPDRDTVKGFRTERDYSFNLGTDTHVYGLINFRKGPITAIRHVFEPQISFSYRPDFTKVSPGFYRSYYDFRYNRRTIYSIFDGGLYGGAPAPGKSESVGLSLNNILEMKVRSKKDTVNGSVKVPILERLNLSTSYNFVADSFKLANLNLVGGTTLFKKIGLNFNATLNPYGRDKRGNSIRYYLWQTEHKFVRLTNFNLTANANLNPKSKRTTPITPEQQRQLNEISPDPNDFVDFNIPWNVNVSYSFNYSKSPGGYSGGVGYETINRSNIVNISGSLTVTKKWNVSYTTGADIGRGTISSTQLSFSRDLHCWQLSMSWIPFGDYKYYSVELRVKSGILQDLKLNKRKEFYDEY